MIAKINAGVCYLFGHSFSPWDILKFRIETEGACFTVDPETGERKPWRGNPELKCRRCGETFSLRTP